MIAETTQPLSATPDYDATLRQLTQLPVPQIADGCVVITVNANLEIQNFEIAIKDQPNLATELKNYPSEFVSTFLVRETLNGAKPISARYIQPLREAIPAHLRYSRILKTIGVREFVTFLLAVGDRRIGTMTYLSTSPERQYDVDTISIGEALSQYCALAIKNAHEIQAKDHLLAMVSHDLKNPLSCILMNTSLLLRDLPQKYRTLDIRRHLNRITYSVDRMARMIRDILDVSRLENGRLPINLSESKIIPIIDEVIETLHPMLNHHSSKIIVEIDQQIRSQNLSLICDRERMIQVFINLIDNAIKFTPHHGVITLSAKALDGEIVFSVSDNGRGIAKKDLPHIFDRFWQAKGANGGAHGSYGLGLSISQLIIHAHGGRIWVESTLGRGTNFYFTLRKTTATSLD